MHRPARAFPPATIITWTPALVRAELIQAVTWVRFYGGPVGPARMRSCLPAYAPTLEDHLAEGWGLPETADDDDEEQERHRRKVMALPPSAARVGALSDALHWVGRHVARSHPGSARMLALWLRCRVYRRNYDEAVRAMGVAPGHAYRLRDRALGLIAMGLDRDGNRP